MTIDEAKMILEEVMELDDSIYQYNPSYLEALQTLLDYVPKNGKWLLNGGRNCECSVCHHEGNVSGCDNYCYNCGARMTVDKRNFEYGDQDAAQGGLMPAAGG